MMPSVARRGLYHCASVVVFILLSTLIGACCTDATPAMRINTTATAAGCAGAQSSSWTDIEIALRRCGTSDDTWKAVASSFEFKVEPAQAHGAQVLLHTLMATRMVPNATDVSWVTQLTPDRLNLFKQMLQRWQGPASVTLYVHDLATALKLIHPLRARVDSGFACAAVIARDGSLCFMICASEAVFRLSLTGLKIKTSAETSDEKYECVS